MLKIQFKKLLFGEKFRENNWLKMATFNKSELQTFIKVFYSLTKSKGNEHTFRHFKPAIKKNLIST